MDDVTDRDIIIAAFKLGHGIATQELVAKFLQSQGLPFTAEMAKQLVDDRFLLTGYAPLYPITELKIPEEVMAKLVAGTPKILIMGELSLLTKEDLIELYKLTPEEVEQVKKAYEHGGWELLRSVPPSPEAP